MQGERSQDEKDTLEEEIKQANSVLEKKQAELA